MAREIHRDYVRSYASYEINISSTIRNVIVQRMAQLVENKREISETPRAKSVQLPAAPLLASSQEIERKNPNSNADLERKNANTSAATTILTSNQAKDSPKHA